jgi:hypothetical protein
MAVTDREDESARDRKPLILRIDWISIVGIAGVIGLCWAMTRLYRLEVTGVL